MTAILLALLSAAGYGTSDFLAGLASRRVPYVQVALVVQLSATASVLVAVPFAGGRLTAAGLGWGALSGLGTGTGAMALYRGLARGHMSVAGSISGVGAAGVPVLGGLGLGDRPSLITLLGIAAIIPAVWLIARGGEPRPTRGGTASWRRGGVGEGLVAGLGFGAFFLALSRVGANAGLWPSAASVMTSAALVAAFWVVSSRATTGRRQAAAWQAMPGARLGATAAGVAIVTYLLATRHGLLVVVAVLAALYPAATVVLARVVLRERSGRSQLVGLITAAGAVVAITAG